MTVEVTVCEREQPEQRSGPSTLSASVRTAAPLWGMPAAASCSWTSRAYGSAGPEQDGHALERTRRRAARRTPCARRRGPRRRDPRPTRRGCRARSSIGRALGAPIGPEPCRASPRHARVGPPDAGEAGDDVDRDVVAASVRTSRGRRARQSRGGAARSSAEIGEQRVAPRRARRSRRPSGRARRTRPARATARDGAADPHDVARRAGRCGPARRGRRRRRPRARGTTSTSASSVAGWLGDAGKRPGRGAEHRAHRRGQHRRGHRAAVRRPRAAGAPSSSASR